MPDARYYQHLVKCQQACPVHTAAGEYVQKLAAGADEEAYALAREPNPLASVCGRICSAPCEVACRRAVLDGPVTIRALKRFLTERWGVESVPYNPAAVAARVYGRRETGDGRRETEFPVSGPPSPVPQPVSGLRSPVPQPVAVIGAGPAGLACAHDLARSGFPVTVFEAQAVPGGMLALGVPEYRLPRRLVELEIASILGLGVTIHLDRRLGVDFSLADVRRWGFRAVFLACGAGRGRELQMEGIDLDGVMKGIDFLLNANIGYRVHLGRRVAVIGGGNMAVDVARVALRYGVDVETYRTAIRMGEIQNGVGIEERSVAVDVARMALRQGAREVSMVCLESREQMPAQEWEIERAVEEGVRLMPCRGPRRVLGEQGKVTGLETLAVRSVFEADGRFNPAFQPGSEEVLPADTVILATGQQPDLSFLEGTEGIVVTSRGTIQVDPETMATTRPEVFAGGDVAFGPRPVIDAVADGQRAAAGIAAYLRGGSRAQAQGRMTRVPADFLPAGCHTTPRRRPRALPLERRIGVDEVELGFDEAEAREQAGRCLQCQVHAVFDSEKCLLCGGCADVCPEGCLRLVRPSELMGGAELTTLLCARFGLSPEQAADPALLDAVGTAIIKDEERCTRCGFCVIRCPTGAITLERFALVEESREPVPGS
ncbi:MAG: FAD-dependent oxidoreductase [Armatimonadetes bacterium]|nr:FAD-dependent oxidoreductase [Armatimonadota bacterium]